MPGITIIDRNNYEGEIPQNQYDDLDEFDKIFMPHFDIHGFDKQFRCRLHSDRRGMFIIKARTARLSIKNNSTITAMFRNYEDEFIEVWTFVNGEEFLIHDLEIVNY